jgi:hypothetical protein
VDEAVRLASCAHVAQLSALRARNMAAICARLWAGYLGCALTFAVNAARDTPAHFRAVECVSRRAARLCGAPLAAAPAARRRRCAAST